MLLSNKANNFYKCLLLNSLSNIKLKINVYQVRMPGLFRGNCLFQCLYPFYKKRKRDFDQDLCDVSTECKIQKTDACVEIKVQLISVYKPPFVLYLACT